MVDRTDGQNQTVTELVAEAHRQSIRLVAILQELREMSEPFATRVTCDIITELNKKFKTNSEVDSNLAVQNTPPAQNGSAPRTDAAPKIVKEGIRSYFQARHISKEECGHRNLHAALVEDVILALLYANASNSRAVIYQDIADELDRLNLHEERNTTYGRISRLRKEGQIADIDTENRNAYFLTDAGRDYVSKMLKKRLAHGHA